MQMLMRFAKAPDQSVSDFIASSQARLLRCTIERYGATRNRARRLPLPHGFMIVAHRWLFGTPRLNQFDAAIPGPEMMVIIILLPIQLPEPNYSTIRHMISPPSLGRVAEVTKRSCRLLTSAAA